MCKFFRILLYISSLTIFIAGCSNKNNSKTSQREQVQNVNNNTTSGELSQTSFSRIISLTPSITEVLIDLGLEENIVAVDIYSKFLLNEANDLPQFDVLALDAEQLATIEADIIFDTAANKKRGEDTLKSLKEMGSVVVYIDSVDSIDGIKDSIAIIANATNKVELGQELIETFQKEIDKYAKISSKIINRKKVYFEISSSPEIYSFGKGTFLNEIIELIGAENIFKNETGWISVSPEAVVAANPDVIITNEDFLDDSINSIKIRGGFNEIDAVKNNNVYQVDSNSSSRLNHNIVKAIKEIAEHIYQEEYDDE
jgi:iron complex transport system substrate-binding protein